MDIKIKYTLEYLNDGMWWQADKKHDYDYTNISHITPQIRRKAQRCGNGGKTRIIQKIEIFNILP